MLDRALESIAHRVENLENEFLLLLATQNKKLIQTITLLNKLGAEAEISLSNYHEFEQQLQKVKPNPQDLTAFEDLLRKSAHLKFNVRVVLDKTKQALESEHKTKETSIVKMEVVKNHLAVWEKKADRRYSISVSAALEAFQSDVTSANEKTHIREFTNQYQDLLDVQNLRQTIEENEQTLRAALTQIKQIKNRFFTAVDLKQLAADKHSAEAKAAAAILKMINDHKIPATLEKQIDEIQATVKELTPKMEQLSLDKNVKKHENWSTAKGNFDLLRAYAANFLLTEVRALQTLMTQDFLQQVKSGQTGSKASDAFKQRDEDMKLLVGRSQQAITVIESYLKINRHHVLTITTSQRSLTERLLNFFRPRKNQVSPEPGPARTLRKKSN
jgi:hypothetical protein